jgi:pimeloyl-ACP methyl ester carboxylesterase
VKFLALSSRACEDRCARRGAARRGATWLAQADAGSAHMTETRFIDAGVLRVGYIEHGNPSGRAVVLLHGFPYDVHAYDAVAPRLAEQGLRVIVPLLRGYGATRFLSADTPRSGQQAALGADLLALLDALDIAQAIVAGYDWGGRAACVVSALWPDRVRGLVSVNGYNLQDIARSASPAAPEVEYRLWYQYYLHGERGRAGLAAHRQELCRLLWRLWSPTWRFSDAGYLQTASAFDNPDFVDVVVHSYRHRFALVAGDPALEPLEQRLAAQPAIAVPAITLVGTDDGVSGSDVGPPRAGRFVGRHAHRVVDGVGHNLPQEAPDAFARAVLDVDGWSPPAERGAGG